jgi:hypothetical protein
MYGILITEISGSYFFEKNVLPKLQYKKGDEMLLGDVAEVKLRNR